MGKGSVGLNSEKMAGCCVHGYELPRSIKCEEFRDSLEPGAISREPTPRGFRYIAGRANVILGTAPNNTYLRSSINIRLLTLRHCLP